VGQQEQPRPIGNARNARDEVRALGHPRVELTRDSVCLEVRPQMLGHPRLVSRRVDRVEPDQVLKKAGGLFPQRDRCHYLRVPTVSR
jgi:hypothetical protein